MANSKETSPPEELCVDRALWGFDDGNQNIPQPVQQQQYNNGSSDSAQQTGVLGNARNPRAASGSLVLRGSYKPPMDWSKPKSPDKYRKTRKPRPAAMNTNNINSTMSQHPQPPNPMPTGNMNWPYGNQSQYPNIQYASSTSPASATSPSTPRHSTAPSFLPPLPRPHAYGALHPPPGFPTPQAPAQWDYYSQSGQQQSTGRQVGSHGHPPHHRRGQSAFSESSQAHTQGSMGSWRDAPTSLPGGTTSGPSGHYQSYRNQSGCLGPTYVQGSMGPSWGVTGGSNTAAPGYPMHHHEQSTHPRWPNTNTQESVGSWSGTNGGQRPASGPVDSFGMSSNYKGNKQNPANHSDNIPMKESCSVWMINLPPECTVNMLLSHIRQCDKVYATVINPPGGDHKTAAAKVVFWSQKGVERLKKQVEAGAFTVGHYAPKFEVNRIRSRAARPGRECRVLQIEGHQNIINEQKLRDEVFRDKFQWQDDSVSVLVSFADGVHILEWRFGSYRCQAENAYRAIQRKIGWGKGLVAQAIGSDALKGSDAWMWAYAAVEYGADPCA